MHYVYIYQICTTIKVEEFSFSLVMCVGYLNVKYYFLLAGTEYYALVDFLSVHKATKHTALSMLDSLTVGFLAVPQDTKVWGRDRPL